MESSEVASPKGRFSESERAAVYRAVFERRDIRSGFLPDAIPQDVLDRLLQAAHHAPSVGFMQPWDFVCVAKRATKEAVRESFVRANQDAAQVYQAERADLYRSLKLEGIVEAPLNLCVVCDRNRGDGLGRQTMPETDLFSTVCAVQNLWLAARAEGLGVGWVSIIDPEEVKRILGVPPDRALVAYLCIGYVAEFPSKPELETAGWKQRDDLSLRVHSERWGGDGE